MSGIAAWYAQHRVGYAETLDLRRTRPFPQPMANVGQGTSKSCPRAPERTIPISSIHRFKSCKRFLTTQGQSRPEKRSSNKIINLSDEEEDKPITSVIGRDLTPNNSVDTTDTHRGDNRQLQKRTSDTVDLSDDE